MESSVFLYGNISTFSLTGEKWMIGKLRQGLGCGLEVIGCGTRIVVRADRSLSHSILRDRLGSGIDNRRISCMNEEKRSICDAIFSAIQDDISNLCDTEIFTRSTFMELGEFFYGKLINTVEGATVDLINTVVSVLNKNSNQVDQNEYYENLCQVLGFELLPKEAYDTVCSKFNELFVVKFNSVVQKYNCEINRLRGKLSQTKSASDAIKEKEAFLSIVRDITEDEEKLYYLSAECNSLRTRKEMLEHAFHYVQSVMGGFCNLQDASEIDYAIRITALSISKEESEGIRNSYFDLYETCLELFEDDIEREHMLFFKVKIYPAIVKANKKYHESSYKQSEESAIELYKEYMSSIPKIDDLYLWKTTDAPRYSEALSSLIEEYELLEDLKNLINASVCLRRRKEILLKSILQYENNEYEIFNNLISILIEGMFADYLRDTTTFARFTRMTIYDDAVLKDKIRYLEVTQSDVYPEVTEYFMFYFNNRIRNRIAHGRYYSSPLKLSDEIFAKELVLDLCLLVHMFVRTSETERMYRFIHGYQAYYQKLIKNSEHPTYGALFNDMIGQKIVSEYDGIRSYRPMQVAYWLVNPYYEKIYEQVEDKSDLLSLRDEFLSKEFWEYVYERLSAVKRQGYDYLNINREFSSVIKALFRCNISNETKQILGKVNALTNTIFAL